MTDLRTGKGWAVSLAADLREIAGASAYHAGVEHDPALYQAAADLIDRQAARIVELERWQRDACDWLTPYRQTLTPGHRLTVDSIIVHLLRRAGREP